MPGNETAKTVLLAEDEPMLREFLTTVLRREGYQVIVADDGQQAIRAAEQHQGNIDVLLTDVRMPHMTGPDLARALRRDRPDVRILMISAYPEGRLILEKGWVFLQKPFRPEVLMEKLRGILKAPPAPETNSG